MHDPRSAKQPGDDGTGASPTPKTPAGGMGSSEPASFIVEGMVERLATACARHRGRTFLLWVVGAIALDRPSPAASRAKEMGEDRLDGTDVQIAYDLVAAHLPQ